MSSLLSPFSVREGPCDRRLGASAARHQRAAAPGPASPAAHHSSGAARRRLAAAAVGGRKVTHPGKAILAGGLFIYLFVLMRSVRLVDFLLIAT